MALPSQFRAARALLNLKQQEVSSATGVGVMVISDFENERTHPKASSVDALRRFYEGYGVEFSIDGGLRIIQNSIQIFDGPDCYMKFIAEAHAYLARTKGEILFSGADDRRSPSEIIQKFRTMRADGISMRSLIRPADDYILGNPSEYRWMPEGLFVEGDVKAIFADRVAWLVTWLENSRVIMIKDPMIAQEATRMFEYLWARAEGPQNSSAQEKY